MKILAGFLLVLMMGCVEGREVTTVPDPEGEPAILNTAVGPVEILSMTDHADYREILLHHEGKAGSHLVRSLEIRNRATGQPGQYEVEYRLLDRTQETCRWVQLHQENPATTSTKIRSGGDVLRWEARRVEDRIEVTAEAIATGTRRQIAREVNPTRLIDAAYLRDLKQDFHGLYTAGPLRGGRDLELLAGVIQSEDWATYLIPASDDDAQDRLRKVCVAASATAKIACFAARFLPWAWVACVPASGISIACLVYQIQREFVNPQPGGCPSDCGCVPGGG